MSSRVEANSDDVDVFRQSLVRFHEQISNEIHTLQSQLQQVGQTWRDPQYDRFDAHLQEVVRGVNQFLTQTVEEHLPYLATLIERLRMVEELSRR